MMQTSSTDDDVDKVGAVMTTVILVGSGVLNGLGTQAPNAWSSTSDF